MSLRSVLRVSFLVILLSALMPSAASAAEASGSLGACVSRISEVVSVLDTLTPEAQRQYALTVRHESCLSPHDTTVPYPVELTDTTAQTGAMTTQSALPSSYDSRSRGVISSVKNQDALGVCWAFAIAQAAEASYLSNNPSAGDALDLSEWQLAYFMYNRPVDELSNTLGDATIAGTGAGLTGADIGTYSYYATGGNAWLSMFEMANGVGFAHESSARYAHALKSVSSTGRAVLNDEKCYQSDALLLKNAYNVSPTSQPSLLKSMIMEKGAGTLHFTSDSSCYRFAGDGEDFGASFYNPQRVGSGHVVAVVGWDDGYSRDNFGGITGGQSKPRGNGAWLVKNSWGSSWGDGGYFWISYEEPSLSSETSLFVDIADNVEYDHAYYYDGSMSYMRYYSDNGVTHTANIFTAKQDETLKAVSFFTVEQDVDYEVEVYLNPCADNPSSGVKVVSGVVGSVPVPGYQTVELEDSQFVNIDKGETFAVVVKQTANGHATAFYADKSMEGLFFRAVSTAHSGESFVSRDGENWIDLAEGSDANVRVKAFTEVRESADVDQLTFEEPAYRVEAGMSAQLTVLSNGKEANTAVKLDFTTSDSSIARIDGLGVVYAQSPGAVQVKAARNGEVATCEVEVVPPSLDAITKAEGYATQEAPVEVAIGSTAQLEYTTSPKGKDVDLTWSLEQVDGVTDGYAWPANSVSPSGLFAAEKEGLFKVTATYANADSTKVAQEFFVKVITDVVECEDFKDMACTDYGSNIFRSYIYTGEVSEAGYVIGFDERCALEEGRDYVYVIGADSPITGQLAYDCTNGWSNHASWCKLYTGKELAGAEVAVPHPYFAVVLSSDSRKNDWGFAVTSLRAFVPAERIVCTINGSPPEPVEGDEGDSYFSVELPLGQKAVIAASVEPSNADEHVELLGRNDHNKLVSIDECDWAGRAVSVSGTAASAEVTAQVVGTESLYLRVRDSQRDVDDVQIAVQATCAETPSFEIADATGASLSGQIVALERNDSYQLGITNPIWASMVEYVSSNPTKVYVSDSGEIACVGVGEAVVTARYTYKERYHDEGTGRDDWRSVTVSDSCTVQVTAPDPMTPSDMRTSTVVYGMREEYVYTAPAGSEIVQLYFSSGYAPSNGCVIRVLDGNDVDVPGSPFTSLTDKRVPVESGVAKVVFDTTGALSESDSSPREGDLMSTGGFTVGSISYGKRPTGISLDGDIEIDLDGVRSVQVEATLTPDDAIRAVRYSIEGQEHLTGSNRIVRLVSSDGVSWMYGLNPGEVTLVATTPTGLTARAKVTVKRSSTEGLVGEVTLSDEQGGAVSGSQLLNGGETVRYKLSATPASLLNRMEATSTNRRVATAYLSEEDGVSYLCIRGGIDGEATVSLQVGEKVFQSMAVRVSTASREVIAEDGTFTYDGKPHSITASCAMPGAIIEYGTEEGSYNLASCPAYTDAGVYDVFIRARYPVAGGSAASAALSGARSSDGTSGSLVAVGSSALLAPQEVIYGYSYAKARITIVQASLAEASLSNVKTKTYNARVQSQSPTVVLDGKTLECGSDYSVSYQDANGAAIKDSAVKAAGSYYVVVKGVGNYKDSVRAAFKIKKAANPMKVKAKSPSVAYSKTSAQTIDASRAFSFTKKAKGAVTYARVAKGSSKYLTIGKKGKITVAKKTPRGTQKIKVRVRAAGNANYKASSAKVIVPVKVK